MRDVLVGRRTSRWAIAGVVLVLVGSLLVLLLLATHGARSRSARRDASSSPRPSPSTLAATSPPHSSPTARVSSSPLSVLRALPRTDDPVAYARSVAAALFGVDPAVVSRAEFLRFWEGELPTVVYADAAVHGLTLEAQNRDAIDNLTTSWIPPQTAWAAEASEHATNRFEITSVSVPDYWVQAVAAGKFRDPGLRMERVMGVLSQSYGADPAHRVSAARSIVIDLGLLCGPTQPGGCRLLAPQQSAGTGGSTG